MKENLVTDERTIIQGCVKGESWAQRAVYDRYASSMMAVCMRYVPDKETARDLLQEGFIKVFTKIGSYSGTGVFAGWVRRVFVTTALEYLRHNDVLKESGNIDDTIYHTVPNEHSVLEELTAQELMDCIARLSDGYRTVFNLYVIEGYSHSEIAEILGISEVTSRTQFMRARKILQKEIEQLYKTENVRKKQAY
jgi:RNA polymerase sigma factor (sigma-70 family)